MESGRGTEGAEHVSLSQGPIKTDGIIALALQDDDRLAPEALVNLPSREMKQWFALPLMTWQPSFPLVGLVENNKSESRLWFSLKETKNIVVGGGDMCLNRVCDVRGLHSIPVIARTLWMQ